MFEALEAGKKLDGDSYDELELPLRQQLLAAQFDLAKRDYPLIVLLAGLDGAGKGSLAHRLNVWLDPRRIDTCAFWFHSDEEESRPYFWRFWRKLPPRGQSAIFLGAWYTQLLYAAIDGNYDSEQVAARLAEINSFERTLTDDGALLVKLWLHVDRDSQRLQLTDEAPRQQQNPRVEADAGYWWDHYDKALHHAERLLLATNGSDAPWHLIEAQDRNYREISAGNIILQALAESSGRYSRKSPPEPAPIPPQPDQPTILDTVATTAKLERDKYHKQLRKYQNKLEDLAWRAHRQQRSLVAVFEGWDAAGKGSAIRRVTGAMDPRLYRLLQYAAPTDEEQSHHYLWRFWRSLEPDGRATLFDRSWYGRVLVERVENFASADEWQRAYGEINHFEQQLVAHGSIVVKFWLHITPEEQLRRFKDRELQPHKQYKITQDDWRNREKWQAYESAVEAMVSHTSTRAAPWTLVAGNNKHYARIQILQTLCKQLAAQLEN